MRLNQISAICMGFLLGLPYASLHAQASPPASSSTTSSTSDRVYTAGQAQQGIPLYTQQCASCHSADLQGNGQAPPLIGDDFIKNWQGLTLGDLFDKIQTQMPADHPGTLTREQNAGILAYIMSMNKFLAGKTELPVDPAALKKIRIDNPPKS